MLIVIGFASNGFTKRKNKIKLYIIEHFLEIYFQNAFHRFNFLMALSVCVGEW